MTKPRLMLGCAVAALWIGAMPAAALAQTQPAPAPTPTPAPKPAPTPTPAPAAADDGEIVVTGELRGAVPGDIKPEIVLGPADIRAYGVSSISDLITELAPQTRSGRSRDGGGPVILLNGRRISSFAELRDLPVEAIERTEILPEEAALKLGYTADQRVVNIVLRPRFRAITIEATGGMPTAGGFANTRASVDILKISRKGRVNIDVQYNGSSGLLESERDVLPTTTPLFDFRGNITAPGGTAEIDPALSALAGTPVTIAGVPTSAAGGAPTLASFSGPRNTSDVSSYRTLMAPNEQLTVNGVWSPNISRKVTASFNARLDVNNRESLLGLPGVTLALPAGNPYSPFSREVRLSRYIDGQLPLRRNNTGRTAHLGFTFNGDAKPWRWSLTGNYDRVTSRSVTDTGIDVSGLQSRLTANDPTFNPFAPIPLSGIGMRPADLSESTSSVASLDALINGPVAKLPGGDISVAWRVSGRTTDFDSSSFRSDVARSGNVARDIGSSQLNVDIPIANRNRGGLTAIGNFSLNGNVEVEQLSDFGTLLTTGYGAVWSPIPQVRFIASVTDEEGAPSPNQLGDPVVTTPNARVFDYVRGETVDITSISGGNPNLGSDSRHVMKIGVNISPIKDSPLNFSADYVKSSTRNQISSFPSPTAEVEGAFPGRFVRDVCTPAPCTGRLLSVDYRPVNFGRAEHEELRWGVNWSAPLGSSIEKQFQKRRADYEAAREKAERDGTPPPPNPFQRPGGQGQGGQGQGGQQGQQAQRPPQTGFFGNGGGRGPGAGGGGGGRGGGFGQLGGPNGLLAGRIQLSLYHTIHLKELVVIGPGLPQLDLLNGSATGSRGGQPRHEVEAQAGISKDGYGFRLIGKWQSGTEVRSGTLGSGNTLDFSGLGTVNLRAFIDLSQQLRLVRKHRWMLGTRVTLQVDNILDARLRVTDQNGVVPLSYQPDLLDPQGRVIRLSVRKLFF